MTVREKKKEEIKRKEKKTIPKNQMISNTMNEITHTPTMMTMMTTIAVFVYLCDKEQNKSSK